MRSSAFMMFSNLFLGLPVLFAALYHEWLYCFFASGIFVFSPLFHWWRVSKRSSFSFRVFKILDWLFAIGAFVYMYFYIHQYAEGLSVPILYCVLTLVVVFFWYGWKRADYEKFHPWFHIIAPLVSSLILVVANT